MKTSKPVPDVTDALSLKEVINGAENQLKTPKSEAQDTAALGRQGRATSRPPTEDERILAMIFDRR